MSDEITADCPECPTEFSFDPTDESQDPRCPECGFGPEVCSHPIEYRESQGQQYDVEAGQYIEYVYCGKCGSSIHS